MKTIKSFLKTLIVIRDQPITHLKGCEKLTDEEFEIIGYVTADIANDLGEEEFQRLLIKFKVKNETDR